MHFDAVWQSTTSPRKHSPKTLKVRSVIWVLCTLLIAASTQALAHRQRPSTPPAEVDARAASGSWTGSRWSPLATGPAYLRGHWKRAFDLAAATVVAVPATPLVGLAALAIWIDDYARGREQRLNDKGASAAAFRPKSPFFIQERVTRGGNFEIWKLRTMRDYTGPGEMPLPYNSPESSSRVTRVGHCLRRCFVDELPQLLNVFAGQMSLVGPRPPQPKEVEEWTANVPAGWGQPWRRSWEIVRAGVTGPAQVKGHRQPKTYDELRQRMEWDLDYVQHASLATDTKLLVMTSLRFLRGQGD